MTALFNPWISLQVLVQLEVAAAPERGEQAEEPLPLSPPEGIWKTQSSSLSIHLEHLEEECLLAGLRLKETHWVMRIESRRHAAYTSNHSPGEAISGKMFTCERTMRSTALRRCSRSHCLLPRLSV